MKQFAILCSLVAAFLCFAQNANAQYSGPIHRDGSDFVDSRGNILSDQEIISRVGANVYNQTVIGARRQYNAGRSLIIGGAIGAGVGVTGILGGLLMVASSGLDYYDDGEIYADDEDLAIAGAGVMYLGAIATAIGGTVLSVGIPLKVIGQSRLNWVENNYTDHRNYSLHVGATQNGVGLALRF